MTASAAPSNLIAMWVVVRDGSELAACKIPFLGLPPHHNEPTLLWGLSPVQASPADITEHLPEPPPGPGLKIETDLPADLRDLLSSDTTLVIRGRLLGDPVDEDANPIASAGDIDEDLDVVGGFDAFALLLAFAHSICYPTEGSTHD